MGISEYPITRTPAPMGPKERSLSPDIARGLLLIFIAIANIPGFCFGPARLEESLPDRAAEAFNAMFVVNRSRPLFAILFGFGIAMMASRMAARGMGQRAIRRVLGRRSLWLIVIGMLHSTFLWPGDIIASYGVTALIALFLVDRDDRVLRRCFSASIPLMCAGFTVMFYLLITWSQHMEHLSFVDTMLTGAIASVFFQALSVATLLYLPPVIIGFWFFRSGWLVHPGRHIPELLRTFGITMVATVVLSLPAVLSSIGVWMVAGVTLYVLAIFEILVGIAAGAGYVCGFALLAARWADRGRAGLPGVLAAVGERSMTAYLLQSVLFFAVVGRFGLGLGESLGTLARTAVAVVVWAVIALGMAAMARSNRRGPFEILIRHLTYRGLTFREKPGTGSTPA
jgi:uncharacterized protein